MLVTQNSWPWLTREPSTHFVAPNGVNDDVSAASADLAVLASYFVQWWNDNLEAVRSCHGWRKDNSVNPSGPRDSNHLSATAWDVNGAVHNYELYRQSQYRANPLGEMGFSQAQLDRMRAFSRTVTSMDGRAIFRLGIDFDRPFRDPMHFEVNFRITTVDIKDAADTIRNGGLDHGLSASGWKTVQKVLGVNPDGIYGLATAAALVKWQKANKLVGDGIWGPKSQAVLDRLCAPKYDALQVDGILGAATIRNLQIWAGAAPDGIWGPATEQAIQRCRGLTAGPWGPLSVKSLQRAFGATQDGIAGPLTWRAVQAWFNAHLNG